MLFLHLLRLFSLINQLLLVSPCNYTIDNLPQYNVKESITLPFYIIKQGSQVSRKFMAELIILNRSLSDSKTWFPVFYTIDYFQGLLWWLSGKEPTCNAEAAGWIPELGRSPGGGNGNSLWYSCQDNPMDRGSWEATVHGVTKSWTWLKQQSTHAHNTIC